MDKVVNWTALNRALCEALKVKKLRETCRCGHYHPLLPHGWTCGQRENGDRCECKRYDPVPVYPDLISVDALLPLLAARGNDYNFLQIEFARAKWYAYVNLDGEIPPPLRVSADSPGHALALAAAAALGVEVPYAD